MGWRKGVWVNKKLAAVSVPVRPDDLQQDDAEQQAGAGLHPGVSGAPGDGLAVGLQLQRGECAQEGPRQGAHRRRSLLRGGGRGPDHHRHRQRLRRSHRQGTYSRLPDKSAPDKSAQNTQSKAPQSKTTEDIYNNNN